MRVIQSFLTSLALVGAMLPSSIACSEHSPTPTPAPTQFQGNTTPTPAPTPTLTPTPAPTSTPAPTQFQDTTPPTPTPTPASTSTSNSAPTPTPTPAATTTGAPAGHIQPRIRSGEVNARSVNLGAWLVSEHWMSWESPLFNGVPDDITPRGEYAIMNYLGNQNGNAAFKKHRDTWINEDEIGNISAAGLNMVRVPVGFWIVCDDDSVDYRYGIASGCVKDPVATPSTAQINMYARGSLAYLDKLVNEWAVKYNIAVMLSLHAHQASQNGYEHSAPININDLGWITSTANSNNSINFATFLARRYKNSTAFLGMNIINEPRYNDGSTMSYDEQLTFLKTYYQNVYTQIRSDGNDCVIAISPFLQKQDAYNLKGLLDNGSYSNVWHELHTYYIWGYGGVSESDILKAVDAYRDNTIIPAAGNMNNRLFVGEWCMGGPPDEYGIFNDMDNFHALGRKQLENLSNYTTGGWAFWSWRHSDDSIDKRTGWSMRALIKNGDLKLTP